MIATKRMLVLGITFLALQLLACPAAKADSSATGEANCCGGEQGAFSQAAPRGPEGGSADGLLGNGKTAGLPLSEPTSGERCLKEGEACNPLNDLCCPGYYCPGGLARTCARRL